MSNIEYTLLPYIFFDHETTTKKEANKMITLSEITIAYKKATTAERKEFIELIINDPEIKHNLKTRILEKCNKINGGVL